MHATTNLRIAQARDVRRMSGERGRVSLWAIAPGVCASVVSGHLDVNMARAIVDFFEPLYKDGPVVGFHDWFAVTGYDSRSRIELTSWLLSRRTQSRVFIGSRSKLVAMGVAVANLALGNIVEIYASSAALEATLERVLRESASERTSGR